MNLLSLIMFKTNQLKETMKQCKICNDKPTKIFSQSVYTFIFVNHV
jgi:hypothetical protein